MFTTATVAVLLAAVVAVPLTRGGHGDSAAPPQVGCEPVAGGAGPQPSTEAEWAAARLQAMKEGMLSPALTGPLQLALPGATFLDATTCAQGLAFHMDGDWFTADVIIVDGAGTSRLSALVAREPVPAGGDCGPAEAAACVREELDDGTVVHRSRIERGGGVMLVADSYRPDGVHVRLSVGNFVAAGDAVTLTRAVPPLDEVTLMNLTRSEHLTPWPQ